MAKMSTPSSDRDPAVPALDVRTLKALLEIGGADMRAELCTQLKTDFERLREELQTNEGAELARSAHEVKGLSATVGAVRLADMARALDSVAATLPAAAREVMVRALIREIDVVHTAISDTERGMSGA